MLFYNLFAISVGFTPTFIIEPNNNPFRYRGYYYDTETGWYYLQTRYYNPTWGRFLNADGVANLGANQDLQSYNLYAYCSNNPVMNIDPYGTFNWGNFALAVVGVVAVAAMCAVTAGAAAGAIGVAAAAISSVQTSAFVLSCAIGAITIAEQIIEEGDVCNPLSVINETAEESVFTTVDAVSAGCGTVVAKIGSVIVDATYQIGTNTISHVESGASLEDALYKNTQDYFASLGIDAICYPHTTDILCLIGKSCGLETPE